ncbi:MAG: hypothetical protein U0412_06280 [Nitrospira sp.]
MSVLFDDPSDPWALILSKYDLGEAAATWPDAPSRAEQGTGVALSCPAGSPAWTALVEAQGFHCPSVLITDQYEAACSFIESTEDLVYLAPHEHEQGGLLLSREEAKGVVGPWLLRGAVMVAQVPAGCVCSVYLVAGRVVATVVRGGRSVAGRVADVGFGASTMERCGGLVRAFGLRFAEVLLSIGSEGKIGCLDVVARPNYWNCPRDVHRRVVSRLVRSLIDEVPLVAQPMV